MPDTDYRQALPKASTAGHNAGFALLMSLLPCLLGFLIAPYFAVRALRGPRTERTTRSRSMAWAAISLSVAQVVVVAVLVLLPGPVGNRTLATAGPDAPDAAGPDSIANLVVGDCIRTVPGVGSLNYTVTIVACPRPHRGEVFAAFDLDDSGQGEWPGDDTVAARADQGCRRRLSDYVSAVPPTYEAASLRPTREGWPARRRVLCFLSTSRAVRGSVTALGPTL